MLDFIAQYGPMITLVLTALGSLGAAVYNIKQVLTMGKKVDENIANTQQGIQITQQGVIEAFKTAKIPTEWKIDVSNKITSTLTDWQQKIDNLVSSKLAQTNKLLNLALTILKNTAAANKLTDEEKAQVEEIQKQVTDDDKTVSL